MLTAVTCSRSNCIDFRKWKLCREISHLTTITVEMVLIEVIMILSLVVALLAWQISTLTSIHLEVNLVIIGNTGVGKSTLANKLLKKGLFTESSGTVAETRALQDKSSVIYLNPNHLFSNSFTLTVSDTIGFNDIRMKGNETDLFEDIEKKLEQHHYSNIQLVFLMSLGNGPRLTNTESELIKRLASIVKPQTPPVIFIFTRTRNVITDLAKNTIKVQWDFSPQSKDIPWAPKFFVLHEIYERNGNFKSYHANDIHDLYVLLLRSK
mmetsp:Transcript_13640/g.12351  ORF Transcript_13640/g.12351 Transcript_13640/m.12351 type:complete len:266 (+) Transcript_13640:28-825(+)